MFPTVLFRPFRQDNSRKKRSQIHVETEWTDLHQIRSSIPFKRDPVVFEQPTANFSLPSHATTRNRGGIKAKKMSTRVSNFTDLIQRVTANCLLHPLSAGRQQPDEISDNDSSADDKCKTESDEEDREDDGDDKVGLRVWENGEKPTPDASKVMEMVMLMGEVFEAVSAAKRAYVIMQGAHSPWDPDKMRAADAAVVAELRRLGVLRERFRRSSVGRELVRGGGRRRLGNGGVTVREVVAPYEAAVEELKGEVKAKEREIESLREKLKTATSVSGGSGGGKKGRSSQSRRKVSCSSQAHGHASPAPELFETTMASVTESGKSFTSLLLSLMRSAHWDIAAAVRSIESAATPSADPTDTTTPSLLGPHHAKYALESYVSRKVFQGFDHETFYMDGSLSSLLRPDQFRRDCFTQYQDMKSMDPVELLGVLPTCHFGKFCSKKYLSIVHPKMEESLFGDLEQRRQVVAGAHPRSQFYGEFARLAKAVWLLHLLAFAMEPPPSHFEASVGAEFHAEYMESVVRFGKGRGGGGGGVGQVVGFGLSPGFKLGNGSVIKARVYLVPRK
ncbi:protein GRAVITROPIC IN THE LIGHT 1 isoform X2 [Rhododendron vialii]|uniref:protein GRAVITROPIC IN THE LIGHT 1 isoform X2 n=1 Tax=Rhododendron vialii TaxID=182163 RepID=UPI00265EFB88|nr:protein GRAVITROPIC IN THE LIGHT 1 isoform X2 [Rhododendron vialii]